MSKHILILLLCVLYNLLLGLINPAFSQNEKALLTQLFEEDREVIDALVLYPKDTRLAILETASSPQALIKLKRIQEKTSTQFKALMEKEPKEIQQALWDITRYPNLVNRLYFEGDKNKKKIEKILEDYPKAIGDRAMMAGRDHADLLGEIAELEQTSKQTLEIVLKDFPVKVQDALRSLIELPEVLSLLTENIQLTILVGDLYLKEPAWLIAQSDSLSKEVEQLNKEALVQWQESMEDDPAALEELKASAEEFSEEYGYDDLYYYEEKDEPLVYENESENLTFNHYYQNYPYWFGYPSWYTYPRWRPYPAWWDWGFYFRPNQVSVFFRLPSFYYTNWYFYNPQHHYYYPHLTDHFIKYSYHSSRNYNSTIRVSVNNWRDQNREIITDSWINNQSNRVERIREFGRFESSRQNYNRENPDRTIDQNNYLRENSPRYPKLRANDTTIPAQRNKTTSPRNKQTPVKPDLRQPTEQQRTTIRRESVRSNTDKKTSIRRIDQATEYHDRTWKNTNIKTNNLRVSPRTPIKAAETKPIKIKTSKRNNE